LNRRLRADRMIAIEDIFAWLDSESEILRGHSSLVSVSR
jgi:hypothetical protein